MWVGCGYREHENVRRCTWVQVENGRCVVWCAEAIVSSWAARGRLAFMFQCSENC